MAVSHLQNDLHVFVDARRRSALLILSFLAAALGAAAILSIGLGPVAIAPQDVLRILFSALKGHGHAGNSEFLVVLDIRLPRTLLAIMIGGCLGGSGALMQSLFRNPLADPGLIGVSAGAALAAAATIVLGDRILGFTPPFFVLPLAAFAGSAATTLVLYLFATRGNETSVATLLLAGVALGALASAMTGLLIYMANDRQLRDLTFWSLGSLGGATWEKVIALVPPSVVLLAGMSFLARSLNGFTLGESEAFTLGFSIQRVKTVTIFIAALATGASVAAAGVIGFVGVVVPQLLRLVAGADHRILLPACVLLGAILVLGADICARLLIAPAELPIGILTAAIGAPFFLWLLLRRGGQFP